MDLLKLLCFLISVSLGVAAKHADLEVYWKSKLPNTPMPKAVRDIIQNGKPPGVGGLSASPDMAIPIRFGRRYFTYGHGVVRDGKNPTEAQLRNHQNVTVFFLKRDLHGGSIMNLQFVNLLDNTTAFLPRQVADSIPFSSKSVPEILNKFSVNPNSVQAEAMKELIADCEEPGIEVEDKYCATSLESMVDFTTSKLGKNVGAISTEAQKTDPKILKYVIVNVFKLNDDDKAIVACHKQDYVYAVFYCHTLRRTDAYRVNLVGADDGAKVKAVVVCHEDTSAWTPKHVAFQLLKVKPGSVPICHFLPEDHFVSWALKH
ncbi:BURP domain-containing protein 3-like [Coffea arabica]|uniref:BURP domain-containing protein 3-like n=1 Tax=Coffea arabica TaxID=13443 RepID=A0A6P6U1T9_COFAR|nr:BURP domain-containing protein 3-like [Coffea arabica]